MEKKAAGNPWLSIWTEPRKTVRSIVTTNPKFGFVILSAIYGLPMALNLAQNFSLGTMVPTWAILIGSLIVCTFLGMVGISIATWLLHFTGSWIGGKGSYQTVRTAVAWSNVPNIVTILMWIVLLYVFGGLVFNRQFSETPFIGYQAGIVFIVFLFQAIVSIWGFIILLQGLAEVQGFSAWKALLNILIPFVIVVALIWLVGWFLYGTGSIHN
ncbi:MAG: Yip1 family protein [Rhabdochlamydiaceae bacterium]|jgi:hypothetical protein